MQLSSKQNEYIVNATHRWNIKSGAVRSGKSYVDTSFVIPFRIRERAGKPGLNVILGVSKESIERIPELYFTKLEVMAGLLEGEEKYTAAKKHVTQCTFALVDTLWDMGDYLRKHGEKESAVAHFRTALRIVKAILDDCEDRKDFIITKNSLNALNQRKEIFERMLNG